MKSLGSFGDLNVKTPFWLVTGTNTELTPRNKVIIAWRIQQPGSQHLLFCRKVSVTRTIPQPTQWCWASWLCRTVSPPVPTEFPFISPGSFQQVQPVQRKRASRLVGKQTTKNSKIQQLYSELLYGLNWISRKQIFNGWGKKPQHHGYETWRVIKFSPLLLQAVFSYTCSVTSTKFHISSNSPMLLI